MQALDDTAGLRTLHLGPAVLDAFELQEQLVGMLVVSAAELPSIVRQHRLHVGLMCFEGRQDVVVQQLYGGDRQLVGIALAQAYRLWKSAKAFDDNVRVV